VARSPDLEWVEFVEGVGRHAHRPSFAAQLVAGTAVAFSAVWFLANGWLSWVAAVLTAAITANAYLLTRFVWGRLVPAGSWSYRLGLATGVAVGALAHATVGFAWLFPSLPVAPTVPSPGELLGDALLLSALSVPTTGGVPLLLSVGAALWLTDCRRRVAVERSDAADAEPF